MAPENQVTTQNLSGITLWRQYCRGLSEDNYHYDFSITSYFRMYFTQSKEYGTKGFFAQAFKGYYNGTEYIYEYYDPAGYQIEKEEDWNSFGAGLGIGGKWVNKQGFVFQLVIGIGRNFIGDTSIQDILFQRNAYIEYRF